MILRAHTTTKVTHFELVPEIPTDWSISPIKRLANISYGIGEPPGYVEDGVPLIRATNVTRGKITEAGLVRVNPGDIPQSRITWLQTGDIIVVRSGAYTGDSAFVSNAWAGSIAGFDMVVRPTAVEPRFLAYALLSRYLKEGQIDLERMRAAQPHLNAEELGACLCIIPPQDQQPKLADFLDRETAKIDTLIAEQRALVERLREKRASTITTATSVGLHSDVSMGKTGNEYFPEAPKHWRVDMLKRHWSVMDCKHHTVKFVDDGQPVVSIVEMAGNLLCLDDAKRTSQEEFDFLREGRTPRRGDVILCRNASVGTVAYVDTDASFCLGQDVCLLFLAEGDSKFLYYCFLSTRVTEQLNALMIGATFKRINIEQIRELWIAFPPEHEQTEISSFLDQETAKVDELIREVDASIALLQEHRSALITAVVTGKVDVRGLAEGTSA